MINGVRIIYDKKKTDEEHNLTPNTCDIKSVTKLCCHHGGGTPGVRLIRHRCAEGLHILNYSGCVCSLQFWLQSKLLWLSAARNFDAWVVCIMKGRQWWLMGEQSISDVKIKIHALILLTPHTETVIIALCMINTFIQSFYNSTPLYRPLKAAQSALQIPKKLKKKKKIDEEILRLYCTHKKSSLSWVKCKKYQTI